MEECIPVILLDLSDTFHTISQVSFWNVCLIWDWGDHFYTDLFQTEPRKWLPWLWGFHRSDSLEHSFKQRHEMSVWSCQGGWVVESWIGSQHLALLLYSMKPQRGGGNPELWGLEIVMGWMRTNKQTESQQDEGTVTWIQFSSGEWLYTNARWVCTHWKYLFMVWMFSWIQVCYLIIKLGPMARSAHYQLGQVCQLHQFQVPCLSYSCSGHMSKSSVIAMQSIWGCLWRHHRNYTWSRLLQPDYWWSCTNNNMWLLF